MDYKVEIIRSNRKSISIEIKPNARVIVKAPFSASEKYINEFVNSKANWIEKGLKKIADAEKQIGSDKLTNDDIQKLADDALNYIPKRVEYYAKIIGVEYSGITIRNQKTRWGSCSSKKRLNFNCLLMLTPPEVIDSVVVHELCHIKQMNHSKEFYALVLKAYPNYWECDKWLKQNGSAIMNKMMN